MRKHKRHIIQAIATVLSNANIKGFADGTIWQGKSKSVCVPGLNCYSCPGAVGSCPIGSLQATMGGYKKSIPYYVMGFLLLFGTLFGRLICGFLCPFGFLQDLLYKIKIKKIHVPEKPDYILRYLKYCILIIFVIALPILVTDAFGTTTPWFCKYICPAGTLEGGIFLMMRNEALRSLAGFLFTWKLFLLIIFLISSVLIYRPFCKYICPLGAIYGLFNKFSLYQMKLDTEKCVHCNACVASCKMNVDILKNINSAECIRCGECKSACSAGAISSGFMRGKK